MQSMKRRNVNRALTSHGCAVTSDDGDHTKWTCPCGEHTANIPRHNQVSPGVIRTKQTRMACLPKGWLQK